ncbi:hypothetical protein GCM10016272_02400 [Psychrobacter glaciei]|uniref:Tetratricopeptide repeat protein n=1 Tax=Psychrobacter glaciei TaxID=619771 RepID=A0ABQ3GLX7_9GAMM|nr:hypothetical protein [Psychrobacter glaciei]GHD25990.1 hypothetical protein GCM10016272_02400 [Psychrobacter glaciei]
MASRELQTNADRVNDIADNLVNKYLNSGYMGLIDSEHFYIRSAKKNIERLIGKIDTSEDAILYSSAMGMVYAAQGRFSQAKVEYNKVIKLVPKFGDHFSNYNTVLMGAGDFGVAKADLEEYFSNGGNDFELLLNLFSSSCWDLDFASFEKHYESVRGKDVLIPSVKGALEFHYQRIDQWDSLRDDLSSIGISISLYSEFYKLLNVFHDKHLYGALIIRFEIDNDEDQCLVVDVYSHISNSEALKLTSEFESYMVKYAIANNKRELLSKFLLFFKDISTRHEEDSSYIYLSSDSLGG